MTLLKSRKAQRLHVIGSSPRSGTTLMFELVTACFDIEKIGEHEIGLLEISYQGEKNYCTKKPNDAAHVARVLKWVPSLYVIYMQRDPRDIVVSRHGSAPDSYWCDFDLWQRNQKRFSKIANHPRAIEIRYEDLVSDPNQIQQTLMAQFGFLKQLYPFSAYHKISQPSDAAKAALKGVRKISSSSVGSWQNHLPRLVQQVNTFPGFSEELVEAGYADDKNWLRHLEGVTPHEKLSVRKNADPTTQMGLISLIFYRLRQRLRSFLHETYFVLNENLRR